MKLKKHKKILILFAFVVAFYAIVSGTFSIYREKKGDKIDLSILDASGTVTVNFKANGGVIDSEDETKTVQSGTTIGQLPEATRDDYNFDGWYTEPTGGEKIDENTVVTGTTVDYYAHWLKIVCKKAVTGTLHSETCAQGGACSGSGGGYHANDTIYYGTIPYCWRCL